MSEVRWEYYEWHTAESYFDTPTLNSLGQEGWEMVTVYVRAGKQGAQILVAVFKRQVPT